MVLVSWVFTTEISYSWTMILKPRLSKQLSDFNHLMLGETPLLAAEPLQKVQFVEWFESFEIDIKLAFRNQTPTFDSMQFGCWCQLSFFGVFVFVSIPQCTNDLWACAAMCSLFVPYWNASSVDFPCFISTGMMSCWELLGYSRPMHGQGDTPPAIVFIHPHS